MTIAGRLAAARRQVGLVGGRNARLAVAYARRRDALDARFPAPPPADEHGPGTLAAVHRPAPHRLTCTFEPEPGDPVRHVLEVRALAPGLLLLGWDGALDEPSWAVLPWDGEPAEIADVAVTSGAAVTTGALTVAVAPDGGVTVSDAGGRVRRADDPPRWWGAGWELRSALEPSAAVLGLGGRARGDALRGHAYRLWNTDPGGSWSLESDPLSVTTPAYAVVADPGALHCFHDTTYDGTVAVGAPGDPDAVVVRATGGPLRTCLAVGDTLAAVLDLATRLTGRPALPPLWALGHHQSRWGYRTSEDVRAVWQGFRRMDLPLSAIHLDIDHLDRHRDFTVDPQRYGDLGQLTAELAADGVRVVAIVDAGVPAAEDDQTFRTGTAVDAWVREPVPGDGGSAGPPDAEPGPPLRGVVWPGETVFPDHTRAEVRHWWGTRYAAHVDLGIAGWWHDMNEPACFAARGELSLPRSARHGMAGRPGGGDHREAHNVYGLLMNRAAYEGVLRLRPDRRPFLFSRSGWAGQQRYGGHWTGDIRTGWPALRLSLAHTVGLGMTGVPYTGPDVGGFTADPDPELYARWFQLGSWLPFFRTHGSLQTRPREPWHWPPETQQAIRDALAWRYRLLPTWYTLAREATDTGAPYVRPLAWADPSLRDVGDAFLVGGSILVAPVLEPGARRRAVRLPAGVWYDAARGARFVGGRTVTVPAPLGRTPWFVRAGAVLPMTVRGSLVLLATPPEPGEAGGEQPGGTLWTDGGDGWGPGRREAYAVARSDTGWTVRRGVVADGPFPWSGVVAAGLGFPPDTPLRVVPAR